jgi:hypothetical protein
MQGDPALSTPCRRSRQTRLCRDQPVPSHLTRARAHVPKPAVIRLLAAEPDVEDAAVNPLALRNREFEFPGGLLAELKPAISSSGSTRLQLLGSTFGQARYLETKGENALHVPFGTVERLACGRAKLAVQLSGVSATLLTGCPIRASTDDEQDEPSRAHISG